MRREEEAVARALIDFFGGPTVVSAMDGEDPPDLYLSFRTFQVGVEVTRLSQFTLEPDETQGNRATQDSFGLRLIEELNIEIGPVVPENTSLLLGLSIPVANPARFRKELSAFAMQVAQDPKMGIRAQREIEGTRATISVIPGRLSGKKIVGFVSNANSSADIGLNARLILEDRIRTKTAICERLPKPIWLAMLNDYWIADAETYEFAAAGVKVPHCFERLFFVASTGEVTELKVGA